MKSDGSFPEVKKKKQSLCLRVIPKTTQGRKRNEWKNPGAVLLIRDSENKQFRLNDSRLQMKMSVENGEVAFWNRTDAKNWEKKLMMFWTNN